MSIVSLNVGSCIESVCSVTILSLIVRALRKVCILETSAKWSKQNGQRAQREWRIAIGVGGWSNRVSQSPNHPVRPTSYIPASEMVLDVTKALRDGSLGSE
jgi:hypothetical protein